ncbi:MAG: nitrous oxide-stimulated promoter family protein [Prevotellaceae bacterium]|jgi:hypothetical protein|nr:nitrous oxide-stimulated promoter family protein [Prevotellaceae bacterium]
MSKFSQTLGRRRKREAKTIKLMIELYCRKHHPEHKGLCDNCTALYNYAMRRLSQCLFEERKPTCAKCPVHCYAKTQRISIRAVMRYSGWRILFSHPCLAIAHLRDGLRGIPSLNKINDNQHK